MKKTLAIVGATGMVGRTLLQILKEKKDIFSNKFDEIFLVSSEKSKGKKVLLLGKYCSIISLEECLELKPSIAIFSAGSLVSLDWAPKFAESGCIVIDNSSAWRKDITKKLIVPEINASILTKDDKIISNPNCSTIQLVVALRDIHKRFKIKRLVISTYQSVTGTGVDAIKQLESERKGEIANMVYPYPIDKNCLPHGGDFNEDCYTSEEQKLVDETKKIFNDYDIKITATVVRVPVLGGHSESVNIETYKSFEMSEILSILKNTDGVTLQNNHLENEYPMPITAQNKDDVFVGRVRRDLSVKNGLNLWIVADNLRKGAATNAIQIAEFLMLNKFID